MTRTARTLALVLLAGAALAPGPSTGGFGGGAARPVGPGIPRGGVTGGGGASQGLERLRSQEQQNRLEDLRRDSQRRLEADRLRAREPLERDSIERQRLERRWRAEDRATDFQRDREREAIERSVDVNERLEDSAERLPGGRPVARPDGDDRAAFDREVAEAAERERIERLRRDAKRRVWVGPGVRGAPPR